MMPAISFPLIPHDLTCDRCGQPLTKEHYAVTDPGLRVFFRPNENVICIECLKSDSFYLATCPWAGGRGQDAAEYAFLLALIAVVIAAGVTLIGCDLKELFSQGVLTCWQGLSIEHWP